VFCGISAAPGNRQPVDAAATTAGVDSRLGGWRNDAARPQDAAGRRSDSGSRRIGKRAPQLARALDAACGLTLDVERLGVGGSDRRRPCALCRMGAAALRVRYAVVAIDRWSAAHLLRADSAFHDALFCRGLD